MAVPSVIALLVYGAGFPAVVGFIVFKNRRLIKEDQLLRAYYLGETKLTNLYCYYFRKRYHRLYYHFKGKYYYWALIIIGRKMFIALTALMFQRNAAFQMSMALLVLFVSYSLQVKHRPYLSPNEYQQVTEQHEIEVFKGHSEALILQERLKDVLLRQRKKGNRQSMGGNRKNERFNARDAAKAIGSFLVNYNSVELILLGSGILVCLAAVMFETEYLQQDFAKPQRDAITVLVLFIIIASIVYFFTVCVLEIRAVILHQRNGSKTQEKLEHKKALAMRRANPIAMGMGMGMGMHGVDIHTEVRPRVFALLRLCSILPTFLLFAFSSIPCSLEALAEKHRTASLAVLNKA